MRRAAFVVIGVVAALAPPMTISTASASHPKPHVWVRPRSVMVNTAATLRGRHFPANTMLTIAECSEKSWIAPQNPCAGNSVQVTTNAKGNFKSSMHVEVCPAPRRGVQDIARGFEQSCYVGSEQPSGVDVIELIGATKITVTGP